MSSEFVYGITISIDHEEFVALRRIAEQENRSLVAIVKCALDGYLGLLAQPHQGRRRPKVTQ